ncbi:hypothetical protein ACS6OA_22400 [Enterobacter hormaechei subsp. steigerwaltii]|uniref:hypothetical protein n=1 Tax=Enterobacter hormaechei TaxID=158836 RepID=UPI003F4373A5
MSTWTIINGKLDFNPPHDIDIVEACQIESPCKTRCAIFYTLKPYGCLSQPDLSKILERILHRYTDLVQISRSLIESVWGSYIFWLLEKKTGTSVLLCDPMQSVRLFYRIGDGVTLIDTAIEKMLAGHPSQAQSLFQKQLHELGLISSDFIDCAFKKDNTEITVDRYRHYPATQEMVADLEKMISIQPCFSDCAFPRTLSPLLTLPVVEAALATPIYKHFDGNIDRTILRHAAGKFGDCEPLWRRSKGAFDSTLIKGLMKNRTNIESFLLDGVLVQQKILQKSGIDNAFRRIIAGDVSAAISLALPLCVEMFCNAWKD